MGHLQRPKILLVEDDPGDAELIINALRRRDLDKDIVHVEDGAQAIQSIFKKHDNKEFLNLPQVIILDLNMPKINGIDFLERIGTDPGAKRVPVVVFSSSREESDLRRCYDLGVNSYIVKPVEFTEFSEKICEVVHYWLNLNQIAD